MSKINKINVGGVSYDIEDTSKEALANKVTSLDAQSTDTEYPSAKAVFDLISSMGDGTNIGTFYVTNSTPFILSENKIGVYINESIPSSSVNVKIKKTPTSSDTIVSTVTPLMLFYYVDVNELGTPEENTQVATLVYIAANSSTDMGKLKFAKYSVSTNGTLSVSQNDSYFRFLSLYAQQIDGSQTFTNIPDINFYRAPTSNKQLTPKQYVDDLVATKTIQYATMPTASVDNLGKIVQYTGITDSTYTNGYFYVCVSDGQDPATYSWEQTDVQPIPASLDLNIFTNYFDFNANDVGLYVFDTTANKDYILGYTYFIYKKNGVVNQLSLAGLSTLLLFYLKDINEVGIPSANTTIAYTLGVSSSPNGSIAKDGSLELMELYVDTSGTLRTATNSDSKNIALLLNSDYFIQTIKGLKKFTKIPQVDSYTEPTQDTELTAKKYVDDAIAAISSGASVNYFDARQAFLFEGKDVGIYYPTNTNRINFMYNFLSGDSGGAKNGTVISFVIVNKVTAENPDSTKTYAVGTFLDGAGALQQFVLTYNGTNYVMTYYNNYYGAYMLTNYAQTINGIKTFGSFPVTPSSAPTSDYQTANKKYVDDLVGNINTILATLTTPSNGGGN